MRLLCKNQHDFCFLLLMDHGLCVVWTVWAGCGHRYAPATRCAPDLRGSRKLGITLPPLCAKRLWVLCLRLVMVECRIYYNVRVCDFILPVHHHYCYHHHHAKQTTLCTSIECFILQY